MRSIFSPSSFLPSKECSSKKDAVCVVALTFIRGMFSIACMAVNNIRAAVTQ